MFPTKPSGKPLSTVCGLRLLRRVLFRLGAVSAIDSPTIADLKRLLTLRIDNA
jgi:hypothetical protein